MSLEYTFMSGGNSTWSNNLRDVKSMIHESLLLLLEQLRI